MQPDSIIMTFVRTLPGRTDIVLQLQQELGTTPGLGFDLAAEFLYCPAAGCRWRRRA
jgi:hypothetical protein